MASIKGFRSHPRPSNAKIQQAMREQHLALLTEAHKVEFLAKALAYERSRTIRERIWTRTKAYPQALWKLIRTTVAGWP